MPRAETPAGKAVEAAGVMAALTALMVLMPQEAAAVVGEDLIAQPEARVAPTEAEAEAEGVEWTTHLHPVVHHRHTSLP
jgi:hypothetical protein